MSEVKYLVKYPLQKDQTPELQFVCHYLHRFLLFSLLFLGPKDIESQKEILHKKKDAARKKDAAKKKVACSVCNKVVCLLRYKDHLKTHGEPEEICEICGKIFLTRATLRVRNNMERGIKPHFKP